jgi:hypothetical protein
LVGVELRSLWLCHDDVLCPAALCGRKPLTVLSQFGPMAQGTGGEGPVKGLGICWSQDTGKRFVTVSSALEWALVRRRDGDTSVIWMVVIYFYNLNK